MHNPWHNDLALLHACACKHVEQGREGTMQSDPIASKRAAGQLKAFTNLGLKILRGSCQIHCNAIANF